MLRELLARLQTTVVARPRAILLLSALATVLGIALGLQVEFRTSRSELAPPGDPDQERWTALLAEYAGSEALIACVESEDPARPIVEKRSFVDDLAAAIRADTRVAQVFHRLPADYIRERALWLAPTQTLAGVVSVMQDEAQAFDRLHELTNLALLNQRLAARIAREYSRGSAPPAESAAQSVEALTDLIRGQAEFLTDPDASMAGWIDASPFLAFAGDRATRLSDGYLESQDGSILFIFISPASNDDSLAARRSLLARMRDRAREVQSGQPGFRVAFTGQPAMVVEEMDTVRSDTWLTALIAVIGVSILTTFVFRWRSHALLVLAALAAGVIWSFGAVKLELGYLNLITSSFISTLVGIGVAYGIHPVSEYELAGAHTENPVATVQSAFLRTGPGVTVAAVTTSAAFFSIQLMRFKGFGELGLVAGFGVLLCLLAAGVTLPAMLVVYGTWRQKVSRGRNRRPATVDRVWIERFAAGICRFPKLTTASATVVTLLMVVSALGLEFNTNILDLLPRNAESLRYQRKMAMQSDFSPLFNIAAVEDLRSLAAMRDRAAQEASIERFESVLEFLPQDPAATKKLLVSLQARLESLKLPATTTPLEPHELAASYRRLEETLAEAGEAAFGAGIGELAGPLERARAEAERCAGLAAAAQPELVGRWNAAQTRVLEWTEGALVWLRRAVTADAPTIENLPREIRERFMTRNGKALGFLIPAGSVFEEAVLDRFVAASRRVSAEVTGFPLVFHKMSQRITRGFYKAVVLGAVLVALILLFDYRNLREAALAMLPLAMGVIWMMGAMRLLQIQFNFANLVAVPLIIGVGIDNGVHVVHRIRLEGRSGMSVVLRHTGRAIFIASLTTMIGFGSLALASHRGLASLGLVLLLGVGSCLVTSTVVLPNVLVVLGIVER